MRTTEEAVLALIELDAGISPLQFIELANELVTEICVPLGYTSTRLELIERWLSAHFCAVAYPRTSSESAGGISESYQVSPGMGLDLTSYGQQVKMLDTKGGLAKLDKDTKSGNRSVAGITWMGSTSKESEDYR